MHWWQCSVTGTGTGAVKPRKCLTIADNMSHLLATLHRQLCVYWNLQLTERKNTANGSQKHSCNPKENTFYKFVVLNYSVE